jgi:hypothetical protein
MLRAIVATLIVLAFSSARADEPLTTSLLPDSQMQHAVDLRDQHRHAIAMRNAGIVLAVLGPVAVIAGTALEFHELLCDSCNDTAVVVTGAALVAVGTVATVASIPLWVIGQRRANRTKRAEVSLAAGGARLTF